VLLRQSLLAETPESTAHGPPLALTRDKLRLHEAIVGQKFGADSDLKVNLTAEQRRALIEYLKSI
jgi:hypothetical protein